MEGGGRRAGDGRGAVADFITKRSGTENWCLCGALTPTSLLSPSQVLVERFKDEIVENDILSSQDGLQVWNDIHTLVFPYSNLQPYF